MKNSDLHVQANKNAFFFYVAFAHVENFQLGSPQQKIYIFIQSEEF